MRLFYDWNEPNVRMFAEPNTVEAYEPMARAVYAGVHEADPAAQVVAGNLARYRDAGRDPAAWAARLHADGVPMDFFGVHPYPLRRAPLAVRDPANRIDLLDVPALARLAGVPVIVSEFGWSSDDAGPEHQADWTAQAIEVARCTPGLAGFVFWGFHDHPVPLGVTPDPWVRFGWLDAAGQPKPVYLAAFDALRAPLDCAAVAREAGAPGGLAAARAPFRFPAPEAASDVEPGVLEIEVALDAVHDGVVDAALPPQLDDRAPLGVEQLAPQPLVVLRALLDLRRRPRRRSAPRSGWRGSGRAPRMRSAVSSRTQSSPASSSRRPSAASAAWMRAFVSSLSETPSSSSRSRRITAGQREALEDERGEDHAERQVDHERALREGAPAVDRERQRERRGQRDGSAQAGPADQRRVLPGRIRVALADALPQPPRDVGGGVDPDEARDDHGRAHDRAVGEQRAGRVPVQRVEDRAQLQPDEPEEQRVEQERRGSPRRRRPAAASARSSARACTSRRRCRP